MESERTVVLDCGGHTVKAGFAGDDGPKWVVPNCTATTRKSLHSLVADETETKVKDFSQLLYSRPMEKGYLVDWGCERQVWDYLFAPKRMDVKPEQCSLLMTVAPFTPETLLNDMEEVVFEEYGFAAYRQVCPALLSGVQRAYEDRDDAGGTLMSAGCALVVDAGFSFTHTVPIFDEHVVAHGIRRVNVGGKLLTNYLKEIVSYRAFNMMDETHLVNRVKEALCYCSMDFDRELAMCKATLGRGGGGIGALRREYVLPDFVTSNTGYVQEPAGATTNPADPRAAAAADDDDAEGGHMDVEGEQAAPSGGGAGGKRTAPRQGGGGGNRQTLTMNNERICVPEVLFSPANVGLKQGGVAESVLASVQACPEELRGPLLSNILVTGGTSKFPNFCERLERDLQSLVPAEYVVKTYADKDPLLNTWRGGALLASRPGFAQTTVTKAEYEEHGHAIFRRQFLT